MSDQLITIGKNLLTLKDEIDELDDKLAVVKKKYKAEGEDFLQVAKNSGVDNIKIDGRCVHYTTETRCSMKNTKKGFEFLRKHGHDSLIKETVHAGSLSKVIKEMAESEKLELATMTVDDTGIGVFTQECVRVPKAK